MSSSWVSASRCVALSLSLALTPSGLTGLRLTPSVLVVEVDVVGDDAGEVEGALDDLP